MGPKGNVRRLRLGNLVAALVLAWVIGSVAAAFAPDLGVTGDYVPQFGICCGCLILAALVPYYWKSNEH